MDSLASGSEVAVERFIHNENLKLWRRHLSETTDPEKVVREERCFQVRAG